MRLCKLNSCAKVLWHHFSSYLTGVHAAEYVAMIILTAVMIETFKLSNMHELLTKMFQQPALMATQSSRSNLVISSASVGEKQHYHKLA